MGNATHHTDARGFAGLSSLVTQLDDEPVVAAKQSVAPVAREKPSTPKKAAAALTRKRSSSGWGGTIALLFLVGVLSTAFVRSNGQQETAARAPDPPTVIVTAAPLPKPAKAVEASNSTPEPTTDEQPSLTFGAKIDGVSTSFVSVDGQIPGMVRPAIGTGKVLSVGEIRYCLAEGIRIDAGNAALDDTNNGQVDRFNSFVKDYNARCGNYRYVPSAMTKARSDVALVKTKLQAEGRNRVKL